MDNLTATAEARAVSRLRSPKDFTNKVKDLQKWRSDLERDWKLNLCFYRGQQYVYYNRTAARIDTLPVEDGDKPRYRVRLVSNQIRPGVRSWISRMTKTKPVISASPGSSDERDVKAAQVAEKLLEHHWNNLNLAAKRDEALHWAAIAGQGFWLIDWDNSAGKQIRVLLDPDGNRILDETLEELFRAQLEEAGIEPVEEVVYLGDVRVTVKSPLDVFLDPSAKVFEDAKYAIVVHYLDPDDVESRWSVRLKPDVVPSENVVSIPFKGAEGHIDPSLCKIYCGYFLPTPAMPTGRYVVWSEQYDSFLEDTPWEYPFQELPLVKFGCITVPGSVYDDALVTDARPLQKELNRTISQIVEYKNLTIKPRVWAPIGSLRQRMTGEPGVIMEFAPIGGMRPEVEQLPALPPYVFEHLADVNGRIKEVFNATEITEGSVPPNVEAGVAIDLLQEMATDLIAPSIQRMEDSLARAGRLILAYCQAYYSEPRMLKIYGSGLGRVQSFTRADIIGKIDVYVESGSGLPRTRAGRMARIRDLIDTGLIRPDQAWKHYDLADLRSLAMKFAADEEHALREHEKMLRGIPLNPEAVQQAMMAVNQGTNPETGQPLQSPEEVQEILNKAAVQPGVADNDSIHLETHSMYMKGVEFEKLPSDVRQRFFTHYELTMQKMAQQAQQTQEAPIRVNYQIKGTAGPTAASEILNRAGVSVTPETMTEPPLETWVTDSMDKPDVDEAANDPLSEMEKEISVKLMAEKAREAAAKADIAEKQAKATPNPTSKNRRA